MSRLDELIAELCPDGVEYKKLGEVIDSLRTGLNPRKNFRLNEDGGTCYYITGKDVYENRINISDRTDRITEKTVSLINNRANLHDDMLLFVSTGTGTVGRMALVETYSGDWNVSETMYVITVKRTCLMTKFLLYTLYSRNVKAQFEPKITKGSVPHLRVVDLLNVNVPLPPLPVQQEIVRILDYFTELTAELQKQLDAELSARKKQYEYYRDLLINDASSQLVELSYVVKNSCAGATPKKNVKKYYDCGTIPWIRTQDVRFNEIKDVDSFITEAAVAETAAKWIPENCVIVAISGASAGRCAINKIKATTNQHCLNMEIDPNIALYKYVYYCVCSRYDELLSRKQGARGDLNSSLILGITIPLPSIDQQAIIVDLIESFDKIANDLTSGLPAEIAARQKQYEYYRDKLLTFKELKKS